MILRRSAIGLLLVLTAPSAAPSMAEDIAAEDRAAFDRWVDERIARLAAHQAGAAPLAEAELRSLHAELDAAEVDAGSFLVRGDRNHDFPRMLFYNEFYLGPLEAIDPRRRGPPPPATNADARSGRIRHSSFFTNVDVASHTPQWLEEENARIRPAGALSVTKVKRTGTSEGIWAKDPSGRTFILIFDPPFSPEMTTSAEYIGSTLVRILGWNAPKTSVVRVLGTGDPAYDGRRAVATLALEHFDGGWRYESFRDRREIRALQVVAGWINNVDQTEQNTGVTIDPRGVVRHYVLDFGSSLGSFTFRPQPARLGWTRLFDPYEQWTQPLYNRGLRKVPWEAPYEATSASVGYFSPRYDPDRWQPFYRNLGFADVTHADRVWAAEKIAQISEEQIRSVVSLAGYTHASDAECVVRTLLARRAILLERYLGEASGREGESR